MSGLHGTLGWLTLTISVVVTLAGLATWAARTRPAGRVLALASSTLAVLAVVIVAAALFLGGLLLITGLRPRDMLHVLVGIAALLTLPLALALGVWAEHRGGRGPARGVWVAGGGLLLAALAFLLAETG